MKKIIIILSFLTMNSCIMPLDPSEWGGPVPRRGQADYEILPSSQKILSNERVSQKIGKYYINMPKDFKFKYGSTAYDTDILWEKKRKYLYDEKEKLGTEVYLIEDTIENLKNIESRNHIFSGKNGRYSVTNISDATSGGILIKIKEDLYIACPEAEPGTYKGYPDCEAIVKVMKGQ